jgi:hypothetical protein
VRVVCATATAFLNLGSDGGVGFGVINSKADYEHVGRPGRQSPQPPVAVHPHAVPQRCVRGNSSVSSWRSRLRIRSLWECCVQTHTVRPSMASESSLFSFIMGACRGNACSVAVIK